VTDTEAERERQMGAMPLVGEAEMIDSTVDEFFNRRQIPQFMLRLRGIPTMAQSAALEEHPVQLMIDNHEGWEALHGEFLGYLTAIAGGRLGRAQRRTIADEAHRVSRTIPGDQRALRPCRLDVPDIRAALGFVLHTLLVRQTGRRLFRCQLGSCGKFFLKETRRGHPDRYCSPLHANKANKLSAGKRAKDYRSRQEAIKKLSKRFPASSTSLVKAIKEPGLSVDELIQRATQAARKHK